MREPGTVIDVPGLHLPQRLTHVVLPANIDAHPVRAVGQVRWRLTPGPGDHVLPALQMLDQIASSEAGGAGDQGDRGHSKTAVRSSGFAVLGSCSVRGSWFGVRGSGFMLGPPQLLRTSNGTVKSGVSPNKEPEPRTPN